MKKKTGFAFGFSTLLILILVFYIGISLKSSFSKNNEVSENEETVAANTTTSLAQELSSILVLREDPNLLLCNRTNLLPQNFKTTDIVDSNLPFLSHVTTRKLNSITATNAQEMFKDAKNAGINLLGASGYRTNEVQRNLFQSKVNSMGREKAMEYSAPPGASEHETGYALDIVSKEHQTLNTAFENSAAFKWLNENAYKYGFILRYQKDKEDITGYKYEPWHFRYVGKEHAILMKENNLVLEEYLAALDKKISVLELSIKGD